MNNFTLKDHFFYFSCTLFITLLLNIAQPVKIYADTISLPQTGQTTSYSSGDDGALRKGVSWPTPRFNNNGNGTITDNLTGLIWLRNGNCFGTISWSQSLSEAALLENGVCGLTDNSGPGDWRLPNVRELASLLHLGVSSPALPSTQGTVRATLNDPFTNLQQTSYWSSTTDESSPSSAFNIDTQWGHISSQSKTDVFPAFFVRSPSTNSATAKISITGQSNCYDNTGGPEDCANSGQDGELQKGVVWPVPRFTDNGNGTITDNHTSLIWLKNANCFGLTSWDNGLTRSNSLKSGSCGLSDSSAAGNWRLPNRNELLSLIHYGNYTPALPDTHGDGKWSNNSPFTNLQPTSGYWTSSTYDGFTGHRWFIDIENGAAITTMKNTIAYVLPVRNSLHANLSVSINGSGQVTSNPAGISCPSDCSYDFDKSSSITLTAQAASGYKFSSWSLKSCNTKNPCSFTLNSTMNIRATFTRNVVTPAPWGLLLKEE